MQKVIIGLLFSTSILMAINNLPDESPANSGYEMQRQESLLKEQSKTLSKHKTTVDKIKVDANVSTEPTIELGPSFILNGVSIKGNTTFKQEKIIPFVQPYVGKKVYTQTLQAIASKITKLYHQNGYTTSNCVIPKQKVSNGSVVFQIIEDVLGSVVLSGEHSYEYDSKLFSKYFQKLQGKVINTNELNDKFQLLKTLPISRITPTISRVRPGLSNLILNITEGEQRVSLSFDNMGSYYSGEYRSSISTNINNIVGISDMLFISATTSQSPQDYNTISAYYRHPIGTSGARMMWGLSNQNYQLNPDKVGSDVVFYDGGSTQFNFSFEQPLYLFEGINTWFTFGFVNSSLSSRTLQNSNGDVLVNSLDITSVFSASIMANFQDRAMGYNNFSFKVDQALPNFLGSMTQEDIDRKTYRLNDLNATDQFAQLAKTGPVKYGKNLEAAFTKVHFSASRQQFLPYDFSMRLGLSANYTPKRIPQAYEYSTGDYGYSMYTAINHYLFIKNINFGITYSKSKVYDYDQELNTSTRTGGSIGTQLTASYNNLFASIYYTPNLDSWDNNLNTVKFRLGYSW